MPLAAELDELAIWVKRLPSIGMQTLGSAGADMYILDFVMIGAVKKGLHKPRGSLLRLTTAADSSNRLST
jgi:hypothetical protein